MTTLVNSLPTRTASSPGTFNALYQVDEQNTLSTAQITTARNKYWTPMIGDGSSWVEYTGQIRGDLNGDGVVDVADVTMMISMALGNSAASLSLADLNGDGIIDVADVTAVIRIALSN